MEETNLSESKIINNQIVVKKKIIDKWTFLFPLFQVCCVFVLLALLADAIIGGGNPKPNHILRFVVGFYFYVSISVIFILPFLSFIFLFIKSPKYDKYNKIAYSIINFLICSIIPLFILNLFFFKISFW